MLKIQNLAGDWKTRLCFFTSSFQIKANLAMNLIEGTAIAPPSIATLIVMARTFYIILEPFGFRFIFIFNPYL